MCITPLKLDRVAENHSEGSNFFDVVKNSDT